MKILPLVVELFHADRQIDRQEDRHDKTNFHFSHLTSAPKNVSDAV